VSDLMVCLWTQPCQDERESSYSCSMFYGKDKHTMCKEKFMEVSL
jgi:hypothetical protein